MKGTPKFRDGQAVQVASGPIKSALGTVARSMWCDGGWEYVVSVEARADGVEGTWRMLFMEWELAPRSGKDGKR